uniref:Reverse transcriptase domain-containing protein n=1 Tax=Nothobranchius furzeri TaxID=105023 RepID=A0A8C6PS97_NOTFU
MKILKNLALSPNLPLIAKILERSVASQLTEHLHSNQLFETFQSGFCSHHSTETALIKVSNDLLVASDSGSLSILLPLDLSAAFDTIDHSSHLHRLQSHVGVTGSALSWFTSYLSNRSKFFSLNNCRSDITPVTHGVPQGSVLGTLLFIIFMLPLGHIIRHRGLQFHRYADDSQLYLVTKNINSTTVSTITNCLNALKICMPTNFLKLNYSKSELIITGPKSLLSSFKDFTLSIRNLGVSFDPLLSFLPHIHHVTKTAFFHLQNIARLRPILSSIATETLIHAFISSKIDYCNSLLYGLPSTHIKKTSVCSKLCCTAPHSHQQERSHNPGLKKPSLASHSAAHSVQDLTHHLQGPQ